MPRTSLPRAIRKPRLLHLTKSDWREIYYAVEMKRLGVTADNRMNGPEDDGVDLAAWQRQMEHIAAVLGPDGERLHAALTTLLEDASRVVARWSKSDLQFAVQGLDRALAAFDRGTHRRP